MSKKEETQLALLSQDMSYVKDRVEKIDKKLDSHYVTKEEFEPIKKLVYGLITIILISVVAAILRLIIL